VVITYISAIFIVLIYSANELSFTTASAICDDFGLEYFKNTSFII